MITISDGFFLTMILFAVLAIVFAICFRETHYTRGETIYARLGFTTLGLAVVSALATIWLSVAGF